MAEIRVVSFESAHCSEARRERSEGQHIPGAPDHNLTTAAGNTAVGSALRQAQREGGVG